MTQQETVDAVKEAGLRARLLAMQLLEYDPASLTGNALRRYLDERLPSHHSGYDFGIFYPKEELERLCAAPYGFIFHDGKATEGGTIIPWPSTNMFALHTASLLVREYQRADGKYPWEAERGLL